MEKAEELLVDSVELSPNPVEDVFWLELDAPGGKTDLRGRPLWINRFAENGPVELKARGSARGMYVVTFANRLPRLFVFSARF